MNNLLNTYYTKSIRLTPNGFSLYKTDSNGNLVYKHYKNTQNVLISTSAPDFFEFENAGIQPLDVITATHVPILIPDSLYDDSKAKDYLSLQFDITHFGQYFSDQLAHYRALFFLNQNDYSTLNNMSCLPRFVSDTTCLFRFLNDQQLPESILLSVNDTFADLIVLHKQEPVLINRLQHIDNTDVLYQLLNLIKQFGLLDPTLFIQYFYECTPGLNDLLKKYISNVIIL